MGRIPTLRPSLPSLALRAPPRNMLCPISGRVPDSPIVTPQGHCYEKRLLEEHVKTHGNVDPVTGERFEAEALIEINNGATPDAMLGAMSVTQLVTKIVSEHDLLLLQNFKLRTALDAVKGQLTQALYQHDAACRVVARLTREKDIMSKRVTDAPASSTGTQGFSPDKLQEISENAAELQSARKSRTQAVIPAEELASWAVSGSTVCHEAARPGVLDVAIKNQPGHGSIAVTCGYDGHITLTNLETVSRITRFQVADTAVNCLDVHPDADVIVAGCKNKSLRFYTGITSGQDINYSLHKANRSHVDAVNSVEIHPLGDFVMSSGADNKIAFTDIESGNSMGLALNDKCGIATLKFHPDGNIFISGGMDGSLGVWDLREMSEKLRFNVCNTNAHLTDLRVGENGYHLTTIDTEAAVKVWDLRKFHPTETNSPVTTKSIVTNLKGAGSFNLAVASHNNLISLCGADSEGHGFVQFGTIAKKAKEIVVGDAITKAHTDIVTRVMFVPDRDEAVSVSKDNTICVWKKSQ